MKNSFVQNEIKKNIEKKIIKLIIINMMIFKQSEREIKFENSFKTFFLYLSRLNREIL